MTKSLLFLLVLSIPIVAQDSIVMLYTNNTNGYLTECDCGDQPAGGLAKRKHIIDSLRVSPNMILIDAGNVIGQFAFSRRRDSMAIRIYEKLGYDILNLGDNELVHGPAFTEKVVLAKLPFVSGTIVRKDQSTSAPAYRIINRAGQKWGFLGITPELSFARYDEMKKEIPRVLPEREVLAKALAELKTKADFIVVLSQAGYEEDFQLARDFPEIDLIVGGHDQVEMPDGYRFGKTILVQTAGNGAQIGRLILHLQAKTITSFSNEIIPVSFETKPDQVLKSQIDEFLKVK